ncbi:SDR family NAD(P)-dependent oxidoreductase [Ponticaulis profundi]|uniref:SDR family NAD(P)-dependent oxidoreductase n=1 Tax=Ponticaulis profundi TaxID=2665222 RepID=A0ABW1SF41_9PROT
MAEANSKTVVVTGSTRGIGLGIVKSLIALGCNAVITGPTQAACDAACKAVADTQQRADQVIGVACDVREEKQVQALWDRAIDAFGKVDVWINNAGLALTGPVLSDLPSDEFRKMLEINLLGAMHGSKVAFNGMKACGGAIYNVLGAGWQGEIVPNMIGYATSKSGLTYMTRAFAAEAAGSGVLVNGIAPGVVITEGFLREQAKSDAGLSPERAAVLNIIGDHTETIGDWIAELSVTNTQTGELFNWLTPERIAERKAMVPSRGVLSRYALV